MLAGQLVSIASSILGEYEKFEIINLIRQASSISENRPKWTNETYVRSVRENILNKAEKINNETLLKKLPGDLFDKLAGSGIGTYLPHNIAKMLVAGFPQIKENAISSGELNMYANGAQSVVNSLSALVYAARQLGVETYAVSDGKAGLNVVIPRSIVDNGAIKLTEKLKNVSEWLRYVAEAIDGSSSDPKIIYMSTTDPMLSLEFVSATALGIMLFYKLLLDIAERHLTLYKGFRDLKKSGLAAADFGAMEDSIKKMVDASVTKAVDDAFRKLNITVDKSRENEIRSAIDKKTHELVSDISNGLRIQISVESINSFESMPSIDGKEFDLVSHIEEQKRVEKRIDEILLSGSGLTLLEKPHEPSAY